MLQFSVVHVLALALIMWLFNILSFVKPPVKDVANCVVMVLVIIAWLAGWLH